MISRNLWLLAGESSSFLFASITELKEGLHLSKDTHKLPSQVKMFDNHLATLSIVTLETRPHLSTITQEFGTFQKLQVQVIMVVVAISFGRLVFWRNFLESWQYLNIIHHPKSSNSTLFTSGAQSKVWGFWKFRFSIFYGFLQIIKRHHKIFRESNWMCKAPFYLLKEIKYLHVQHTPQ